MLFLWCIQIIPKCNHHRIQVKHFKKTKTNKVTQGLQSQSLVIVTRTAVPWVYVFYISIIQFSTKTFILAFITVITLMWSDWISYWKPTFCGAAVVVADSGETVINHCSFQSLRSFSCKKGTFASAHQFASRTSGFYNVKLLVLQTIFISCLVNYYNQWDIDANNYCTNNLYKFISKDSLFVLSISPFKINYLQIRWVSHQISIRPREKF